MGPSRPEPAKYCRKEYEMLRESHYQLGLFLVKLHLEQASDLQKRAFLFGCVEPDRNPFTYLKGTLSCHPLRGHNYQNAASYISRLSRRLTRKQHWSTPDYYALGKLVHYITDAFTHSHNDGFPINLMLHRKYEKTLQVFFLDYLKHPQPKITQADSAYHAVVSLHREYRTLPADILHDTRYAIDACCSVMTLLTARRR